MNKCSIRKSFHFRNIQPTSTASYCNVPLYSYISYRLVIIWMSTGPLHPVINLYQSKFRHQLLLLMLGGSIAPSQTQYDSSSWSSWE